MRIRFWGVRGSLPVPGPRTERYGGNTSCVEVMSDAGTRIIVDAGTGLRRLGKELARQGQESQGHESQGHQQQGHQQQSRQRIDQSTHILISHTHWDHIQGLPFFAPLYQAGQRINLYARGRDDARLKTVLAQQVDAPYFPVPLDEARAQVDFNDLPEDARFAINDVTVTSARLNHPYIATAYALTVDGSKVAYVSDTAPFDDILFGEDFVPGPPAPGARPSPADQTTLKAMRDALVRLCEGAELVVYDTMFTAEDYRSMPHFGHSRPTDAIAICREAGARALTLYHHAPERSDAEVDDMLLAARAYAADAAPALTVTAAFEGMDLDLRTGHAGDARHAEDAGQARHARQD